MIVVDTSVLVDHLRRVPAATALLGEATASGTQLFGSVVSRVELLRGMRSDERRVTWGLLDTLDWIDVSVGLADLAGNTARRYRASHRSIDPADFMIAATAEALNAQLWTLNVRHFPMFDGLTRPY